MNKNTNILTDRTIEMENQLKIGENLFTEGKIEDAENIFLNLLDKEPNNSDILNNLGVLHHSSGRLEEAELFFSRSLKADPKHKDTLINLSSLYQGAKKWEDAALYLELFLKSENENTGILNQLALIYLEAGNREQSIATLKQSLSIKQGQSEIINVLKSLEKSMVSKSNIKPPALNAVPGMVSPIEQKLLYECALNASLEDNDIIVEFGAYFGRSTFYLAKGLKQNPYRKPTNAVHTYDSFECDRYESFAERVMNDAESSKLSHLLDIRKGRLKFRGIANYFLKEHLNKEVVIHQSELSDSWPMRPFHGNIAILHIDSPKYYEEFKTVLFRFFPLLKQGSTVIFQNYFYHWSESLIVAVQMLIEDGILVAECTRASSLVVKVKKVPTKQMLVNVDQACLSQDHAMVIDRAIKTVNVLCSDKDAKEIHLPFLSLAKIQYLWATNRQAEASRIFGSMLASIHVLVLRGFIELLSQGFDNRSYYEKDHPLDIDKTKHQEKTGKKDKILHIMIVSTFMPNFIKFIDDNFERKNHQFVFVDKERYEYGLTPKHGAEFLHSIDSIFITLLDKMKKADKIILHGLWRAEVDILLYSNQNLLNKCYWAMWGGDFYFPERHTEIRKQVIRGMGHAITNIVKDLELAKKWYGTKAVNHNCFLYLSNVFKDYSYLKSEDKNDDGEKVILIGNSANPTNNHFEILEKISVFKDANIKVICPLSYGDNNYAKKVIHTGNTIFGDKFKPLKEFLPLEEYIKILLKIDIAIFAHRRQQAMGNIITLLGLGKKVYLRDDITPWHLFEDLNVKVYSFNKENINSDFPDDLRKENINRIKENFSYERLVSDWGKIFIDHPTN